MVLVGFVGFDDIAVVIAFVKTKKRWYEPEIHILCNSGSSAAVDCRCGVLVRPRHRWLRIGNWSQIDIPRGPPPTIDPRIVRQMPLVDASSQIYELWQREGLQGFTGMRFDNDKGGVFLYWKGQVPHRMVALVRTLRTSVPVRVVERPYSLVELQREARRLVELDLSGAGVNVTETGPIPDFSGIGVGIDTTARLDSAQQIDRARQVIESDFLLEFTVAPAPEPLISPNR